MSKKNWNSHTKKTMKRQSKKQLLTILRDDIELDIASCFRNGSKKDIIELVLRLQKGKDTTP